MVFTKGVTLTVPPLRIFKLPGVMIPVPSKNTADRPMVWPAGTVKLGVVKEVIVGEAGSAEVVIDPLLDTEPEEPLVSWVSIPPKTPGGFASVPGTLVTVKV